MDNKEIRRLKDNISIASDRLQLELACEQLDSLVNDLRLLVESF